MQITKGVIKTAQKVVVYGPEGIGKSTFASRFPSPVFIDTEGSTKHMDVARLPKPTSWSMIKEQILYIKNNPGLCGTLIIDTVDWAEQLCVEHICAAYQKKGIEEFGYGKGYIFVKEEFARFLHLLDDVVDAGIHVVLTAHAQIRKFEQPDEMGSYDRWELKLGQKTGSQTSPLVKEWADMVLFANYKIYSVSADDNGKKHKAQGGKRVMYTAHHPCWDAKNRQGLPDELPFRFEQIAHIFDNQPTPVQQEPEYIPVLETEQAIYPQPEPVPVSDLQNTAETVKETYNPGIPKALADLMAESNVTETDVQMAVAAVGYYPADTPIQNYASEFVHGSLIAAWGQVYKKIQEMKSIPEGVKQ